LLVLAFGSGAAAEPGSTSYTATADARLVSASFTTTPGVLFDQLVDGGASAAQAQIDSLGGTSAFASDPYPGATVLGLPGLLAGSSGGQTSSLPPYPLVAASDQSTPASHRQVGTLSLDAQSQSGSSTGSVNDGARSATARTTFDPGTGETHSHAESTISSLQLTSTLTANGVRAVADAVKRASGQTERTSSFEVSSLTVLGQQVAVTQEGLRLLGAHAPLTDPNTVLAALLDRLASQGTKLQFVPASTTEDGATSAGLRITTVAAPPPQAAGGLESVTVVYTLGQASASVTSDTFGDLSGVAGGPLTGADVPGAIVAPALGDGATVPDAAVGASSSSDAPGAVPGTGLIAADISLGTFYPILFLAAVVGLGIVQIIRQLGVRQP
jgi:hypothetical protein